MAMLIVDRIEEGFAVCEAEDRSMHNIPLTQLPTGLREGDCLQETDNGYQVDQEETTRRREINKALQASLFQKKPKTNEAPPNK